VPRRLARALLGHFTVRDGGGFLVRLIDAPLQLVATQPRQLAGYHQRPIQHLHEACFGKCGTRRRGLAQCGDQGLRG